MNLWSCIAVLVLAGGLVACSGGLENGSFTAELNGFNIHYEVHGSGPVVMVVPNSWGFDVAGLRGVYGSHYRP